MMQSYKIRVISFEFLSSKFNSHDSYRENNLAPYSLLIYYHNRFCHRYLV